MRPEREPIPRARNPWGWLGGILTLGILMGGAVAAALALWENVDVQRLTRVPGDTRVAVLPTPTLPPAPAAASGAGAASGGGAAGGADAAGGAGGDLATVLFRSPATAGFFPEDDFYPGVLQAWERLLARSVEGVRTIASASEITGLDGIGMVVAPAAVCLDDATVDAFREHVLRGGSLILTWATGARDGACEWRGWDVVQELTGSDDIRELERRDGLFMTVPAGLPLSGGIEPGARIELRSDSQLAATTSGNRVFWSDWALNPYPAQGSMEVETAAVLRNLDSGGRVLWLGFPETGGVDPLDDARLTRMLENGVRWAAGIPSAEILPWPSGHSGALLLAQEVSGEFANVRHGAALASDRGIPTTFFVVSSLALAHPETAKLLNAAGEVGSQTSDNSVLLGLPWVEQQTRLRRSVSELRSWSGAEPLGLRAPEEGVDEGTLRAWASLGGSYVVGLNTGRTGSPEIIEVDGQRLVLLPRVIKDDYNLIVQERSLRPAEVTAGLLDGVRKVGSLGGLAVVTVHSQLAGTARLAGAIGDVLDAAMADGGWWMASGSQIAEWTLGRSETSVETTWLEDGRLEVRIHAPADRALGGGWLGVQLPDGSIGWNLAAGESLVEYGQTPWGIVVPLGDLLPGEVRTIVLERTEGEVGVED